MTAPLLEQARQGDGGAIAHLLNHALQAHHLQAGVSFADGCLRIALSGTPAPTQEHIVPTLLRGLAKLNISGLQTVHLSARAPGDPDVVWQTEVPGSQRALLRQLAEWGDEGAIAHLLTQALAHKNITVQAQKTEAHLTLSLVATPAPDQYTAMTLLKRAIASWHSPLIQTIEVHGIDSQRPEAAEPAWIADLTPAAPTRAPRPAITPVKPAAPPTKAPPRRWTFKFEPAKLVLVGLLLAYGLFCARHYNFSDFINGTNPLMMFIHGVNLIFHEAGHTIFAMFGQLIHLLAGSGMQILVPTVISGYFLFTRQPFAAAVALCWVGENFWDVSVYIKDAQERALPLLGGEAVLHDWHFILVILRQLDHDDAIGNVAYIIGSLIYAFGVFAAMFYAQIQPKPKAPQRSSPT